MLYINVAWCLPLPASRFSILLAGLFLARDWCVDYPCDETRGNGATAFSDVEALAGFDGERVVQFAFHFHIVTRHDHLVLVGLGAVLWPVESGCLI
jgi:hypothetical protein